MPMCAGGCSAKAYLNDGDFNGELNRPYCMLEEEELKEYLKFYVKRMYEWDCKGQREISFAELND